MTLRTEKIIINDNEFVVKELSAYDSWQLDKLDKPGWEDIMQLSITPFNLDFFKSVNREDTKRLMEAYVRVNSKCPSEQKGMGAQVLG